MELLSWTNNLKPIEINGLPKHSRKKERRQMTWTSSSSLGLSSKSERQPTMSAVINLYNISHLMSTVTHHLCFSFVSIVTSMHDDEAGERNHWMLRTKWSFATGVGSNDCFFYSHWIVRVGIVNWRVLMRTQRYTFAVHDERKRKRTDLMHTHKCLFAIYTCVFRLRFVTLSCIS